MQCNRDATAHFQTTASTMRLPHNSYQPQPRLFTHIHNRDFLSELSSLFINDYISEQFMWGHLSFAWINENQSCHITKILTLAASIISIHFPCRYWQPGCTSLDHPARGGCLKPLSLFPTKNWEATIKNFQGRYFYM